MARGTKAQKPKRTKVRSVKAARTPARKPAKRKAVKPGSRDVYKRRVTTYELTLEEREALAAAAADMGRSTSEVLALVVRAFLTGVTIAKVAGNTTMLTQASDEALGALARRIATAVEQAAISPAERGAANVLREIVKDAARAEEAAQQVLDTLPAEAATDAGQRSMVERDGKMVDPQLPDDPPASPQPPAQEPPAPL